MNCDGLFFGLGVNQEQCITENVDGGLIIEQPQEDVKNAAVLVEGGAEA